MSFLELAQRLRGDADNAAPSPFPTELAESQIAEARAQLGAVLIRSSRFGEVWVVLEPGMAQELVAEEAELPDPRPVILAEDVARLRGKPEEMIRGVLAALAVFPDARLIQ